MEKKKDYTTSVWAITICIIMLVVIAHLGQTIQGQDTMLDNQATYIEEKNREIDKLKYDKKFYSEYCDKLQAQIDGTAPTHYYDSTGEHQY
jgi:hypothetical protein